MNKEVVFLSGASIISGGLGTDAVSRASGSLQDGYSIVHVYLGIPTDVPCTGPHVKSSSAHT